MYTDKRLQQIWLNLQYYQRYQPLSEIIAPLRRKLTDKRGKLLSEINRIWPEIVGADICDLAFPYALQSDIIMVSVASPAVKFMIEQVYRQPILEQVRERTGRRLKSVKCTLNTGRPH